MQQKQRMHLEAKITVVLLRIAVNTILKLFWLRSAVLEMAISPTHLPKNILFGFQKQIKKFGRCKNNQVLIPQSEDITYKYCRVVKTIINYIFWKQIAAKNLINTLPKWWLHRLWGHPCCFGWGLQSSVLQKPHLHPHLRPRPSLNPDQLAFSPQVLLSLVTEYWNEFEV